MSEMVLRIQEEKARFSLNYHTLRVELRVAERHMNEKNRARKLSRKAYRQSRDAYMILRRKCVLQLWIAQRPEWEEA